MFTQKLKIYDIKLENDCDCVVVNTTNETANEGHEALSRTDFLEREIDTMVKEDEVIYYSSISALLIHQNYLHMNLSWKLVRIAISNFHVLAITRDY